MRKSQIIQDLEKDQMKRDIPQFNVGDTLSVQTRIIEGDKERLQMFTGIVVARKGCGLTETVTLYRVSYGSCMERIFPIHSPKIAKIQVEKKGKVRRSKLYYLRGQTGKNAKVQQEYLAMAKTTVAATQEQPGTVS